MDEALPAIGQDIECPCDLVHMVIVRIVGVTIKVGRWDSTLGVRYADGGKKRAVLPTKAIEPHTHYEGLVSADRLIRGVELEALVQARVATFPRSDVIPLLKELPRAQTA